MNTGTVIRCGKNNNSLIRDALAREFSNISVYVLYTDVSVVSVNIDQTMLYFYDNMIIIVDAYTMRRRAVNRVICHVSRDRYPRATRETIESLLRGWRIKRGDRSKFDGI